MTIDGLICKIVAKKGKKTEVEIEDQRLLLSSQNFPASVRDGDVVKLYFFAAEEAKIKERYLAKSILEEILNGK
jgi:hypothetical protein